MLEGLEVSVVSFKELNIFNERFRIDAEFLKKEYFQLEQQICKRNYKRLHEVDYDLIHPAEIQREFVEHGQWFFRTQNIRPLKIESSNDVYISEEDAKRLKKNVINKYDIVITRTGANYGQTAIYNIDKKALGSSHTFILRNKHFNQFYLATFLNTKFGRKLINKGMYGGSQPEIAPYYIANIPIPDLSIEFQNKIEGVFKNSEYKIAQSKTLYTKAENILLQELGLGNWQPIIKNNNTKTLKESFLSSGRIDAEYYQPKYDEIESILKSKSHAQIKQLKTFNSRGLQPIYDADGTLDIINSKHILDKNLDYGNFEKTNIENWDLQERARVYKNDILTYTTGANIGRTQTYLIDNPALASNHVNILRVKGVNPVYVGFVINSIIGRLQTEKYSAGSAQLELYPKDLDEFIIPILKDGTQKKMADKIQQSFALEAQSKLFLELAKKTVEIAIEENEKKAINFLNHQTLNING
ncbi:MAG: restriction endonuclease subunit S [Ferruginibacter sp.]